MNVHNKVAVLGAAGGIGQPLSLLLKTNPLVSELTLFDIQNTPGVAADLSHINTNSKVSGYLPKDNGIKHCLSDCSVVVIPAGVPRKPGMTRDDLFNTNASIVRDLAKACAQYCPKAHLLIIANPVNSTVPICAEVFKKNNCFDPKRLFGVTTLDLVRASRFVSEVSDNKADVEVPVVGGHSGQTIVPLFSQVSQFNSSNESQLKELINRVQFGGDEVVKAKNGTGSATLSMAYAGARFTNSILKALNNEQQVFETAYIKNDLYSNKGVEYFSSKIKLNKDGVEKIYPVENITASEQQLLDEALNQLKGNIKKGVDFVAINY